MIHIPKKVKLGPLEYAVRPLNGDEEDYWGRHDFETLVIRLKLDMDKPQLDIIYLHEVLHALDKTYCGNSLLEKQIRSLSFGLYDFLTRNKIFEE